MLSAFQAILQKKKWVLEQWIIAQEAHEDGNNHIHAWLQLDRKVNIGDPNLFNIQNYHPNMQGVRSNKDVVKYVTKDGNFVSSMTAEEIEALKNSRENKKAYLG